MLRGAIIGYGRRGTELARAMQAVAGIQLAGMADTDPRAQARAATELGVDAFASLEALLKRLQPDLLVLATPVQGRAECAVQAAAAGVRALLVEKPLALTLAEAERMIEACTTRGTLLAVGHHWRFTRELLAMKAALEGCELGTVEFFRGVSYGNLLDQGAHLLDAIRWLAGGARVVWAMAQADDDALSLARFTQDHREVGADPAHPAPRWMTHTLELEGGCRVALETGLLCPRGGPPADDWHLRRILAVGSGGIAECRPGHYFRLLTARGEQLLEGGGESLAQATRAMLEDLRDALLRGRMPVCAGRDARHTLEGLGLCAMSAAQSRLASAPLPGNAIPFGSAQHATVKTQQEGDETGLRFSVILPLAEHRGLAIAAVDSWICHQHYPRGKFQVIVVADGSESALEAAISKRLGPNDRLLRVPPSNLNRLHDEGARTATGRFLVFTESHCLAEPEFLVELDRYLATHDYVGACSRTIGVCSDALGRIDHRLFEEGYEQFRREGDWRKVNIHGFSLRRDIYLEAGGLDDRYDRFAEMLLAAALRDRGHQLGYAASAAVLHHYRSTPGELAERAASLIRGESIYRALHPGLDGLGFSFPRSVTQGTDLASDIWQSMGKDLLKRGLWRGDLRTAKAFVRTLPDAWPGWRRAMWTCSVWLAQLRCIIWRCNERRLEQACRELWDRAGRLARFRFLSDEAAAHTPLLQLARRYAITDWPEGDLLGFHAVETHCSHRIRWACGVAAIRLRLPPGDYEIALDTCNLRPGIERAQLRLFFNTRRVPPSAVRWHDGVIRITIRREECHYRKWQTLVLACKPIRPWKRGIDDHRKLGLPIAALEVHPPAAMIGHRAAA